MTESTVPRRQPILIVAPMPRCGSTLLQRLINSSRRAVIYGENFFLLDRLPDMLADQHDHATWKQRHSDALMGQLLSGQADIDGTSLFPDYRAYLAAIRQSFYHIIRHYDATSGRLGFERWGIKHQLRSVPGFRFLTHLLPGARYVFIYRDVLPVARSMKARWPAEYAGEAKMHQLGAAWCSGMRQILDRGGIDALVLRYEDFIADPAPALAALETFLGVDGIDPKVMLTKINMNAKSNIRTSSRAPILRPLP